MRALLALAVLLAACDPPGTGDDDDTSNDDDATAADDDDDASPPGQVLEGPEVTCDAPVAGFNRLVEESAARGLTPTLEWNGEPRACFEVMGQVVSSDLDDDGDIDVLFHSTTGFPQVYANDGAGSFEPAPVGHDVLNRFGRTPLAFSAVDLDGDGLPEVVVSGADLVLVSQNLGGLDFADWEVLWENPGYPRTCFNSMAFGDLDGDGDLDLFLPGIDGVPDETWLDAFDPEASHQTPVTSELLLYNDPDGWSDPVPVHQGDDGSDGLSILGFFTDRDNDRDLDLFVSSDRPAPGNPPSAFFRNDGDGADGRPELTNDAVAIGADLRLNGMGLGSNDLNEDGFLDYCLTDVADRLACMLSDGQGGYIESGQAIGLGVTWAQTPNPDFGGDIPSWSGWGLEMVDLDNDGLLDVAAVAGGSAGYGMEDALWEGVAPGRFEERSVEAGFNDITPHLGMASDDFDGDGYRDLVISGWETGSTRFWSNPCGAGRWIEVELVGPGDNREGIGARVEVTVGSRVDMQEVHSLRSLGQGSSRIHVGLGEATTIDDLTVHWADGATTSAQGLGTNRIITAVHGAAD